MIQDMVRKFAESELRPSLRDCERAGEVSAALQRKFDELALMGVDLPEEQGGMGLGAFTAALVHEELAWGDPGAAVALWSPHLVPAALLELGDPEQTKRWWPRLGRGAVAWSEAGAALPDAGFAASARRDGDVWILDGAKAFVVNAGAADVYVVFAQIDPSAGWGGVGAFVVDGKAQGLKAGERSAWIGLETVRAGVVILEGVRVADADRLAGAAHLPALRRFFARAMLMTAARQVGLARAAYEYALDYTQDRTAFGKPVAHFQSISFTLAEMAMDVDSARWMVWRAAVDLDKGRRGDAEPAVARGVATAALAAMHANEVAWRVADNAVQLLGGAGYIQDYPAEKWMRDTKALALLGGADQLGQLIVAGAELGRTEEFGSGLPAPWIQPVVT